MAKDVKIFLLLCILCPVAIAIRSQIPSKVQDVTVTKHFSTSLNDGTVVQEFLRVSWSAISGSDITYTVCYSTTSGTQSDPPSGANSGSSGITGTSTTLSSLRLGTTYYIWVAAVSSGGRGPYSDRQQMKIYQVPTRVNPPPTLTKAASSGRPALRVTWTAPSSESIITAYEVQYRRNGSSNSSTMQVTSTSATLESLSAGTIYQVAVRAVSDIGSGPYSAFSTLSTYEVPSQVGPPRLTRSVTSGGPALIVTWTALTGEHPNIRYQVQYRINGSTSWSTKFVTSTSTTLENLSAGTSYQVQVKAVSDVGSGPFSEISENVTMSSTQSLPAKVQGVSVSRSVQGSSPALNVSWSAVNGSGINYTVCYSTTSGTQSDPPSGANCGASGITGTSTTLGPLSGGTTYYIWVAAVSSGGRGPYSDREQVISYGVPSQVGPPVLTKAVSSGRPALRVTWTAPSSERNITKYQVQYRSNADSWVTNDVTSTSTILGNLSASTRYSVRVRANSDVGGGPYSVEKSITTYHVPQQVTGVQFEVDTTNSDPTVTITWERPPSELPITHYWVAISENDTNQYSRRIDGDTSLRINVTSGSTYSATVMAVSAVGNGTRSERVPVKLILEPYGKEVSPTSGTVNSGLSAGLFVAGLASGIAITLLVISIIWGAWNFSKLSQKKSKDSEVIQTESDPVDSEVIHTGSDPVDSEVIHTGSDPVEMVRNPAYESTSANEIYDTAEMGDDNSEELYI